MSDKGEMWVFESKCRICGTIKEPACCNVGYSIKLFGLWSYVKLVVQHFFTYKVKEYEVYLGEDKIVVEAFAVTVANTSQFGNNATISPNAKIDDGLLDVCISRKFPVYALPMLVYRFFNATIDKSGYIKVYLAEQVRVKMKSDRMHFDGDAAQIGNDLQFVINKASLNVITP